MVARAAQQDTSRVIVGLNIPFQTESVLASNQAVATQRAAIQQAQSQLLARLPGYDQSSVINYKTIPYTAVTVDAAGLQALQASGLVKSIEKDIPLKLFLDSSTQLVGSTTANSMGYDGSGQTVAIIDSGVDRYHWFFGGRIVAEGCFSTNGTVDGLSYTPICPNGQIEQTGPGSGVNCNVNFDFSCVHGTHVAGIAAGKGTAFNGVAPNANIIAVQITSVQHGSCPTLGMSTCMGLVLSNVVEGLDYVYSLRNSFNIASVNLSLGSTQTFSSNCDSNFPAMRDIVNSLTAAKIAVIAASGNGSVATGISSPACLTNAVSVGATSADYYVADRVARFSNSDSFIKLLAPGANIMSSIPNAAFENLSGTSMATPHVTGTWAVLKQTMPNATVSTILSTLQNTGVPITDTRNSVTTPRIQLDEAVASATGVTLSAPMNDNFASIINSPIGYSEYFVTRHATSQSGLNLTTLNGGCGGGNVDKDVWFRYQSTTAGSIIVSAEGSSFDTLLAVWTNVPGAPNLVGCHDNLWDQGKQSRLTVTTTANTTYYIQVGGRNNAGGLLHFSVYTPSNNDAIANAKIVSSIPYDHAQDTTTTTQLGNDPVPTNCSDYLINNPTPWYTVWYRYVPTQNESIAFNTLGSNFNTLLSLWKGQPGSLTPVACHDDVAFAPFGSDNVNDMVSVIQTELTAGETYYLMAGGKDAFFTNIPNGELKVDIERWYLPPTLNTPTQTAPADNATIQDIPPTLTWSPVSGATAYDLQIDINNIPVTSLIRVTGNSYKLPPLQANTYYWRIRAVNGSPTSEWSSVRHFTYSITPNSANDAPPLHLFTTSTPILTWSAVSWAVSYEVVIAQNPQFNNVLYTYSNVDGLTLQTDALIPGTYYWRVRARHADKSTGMWSSTESFVITG